MAKVPPEGEIAFQYYCKNLEFYILSNYIRLEILRLEVIYRMCGTSIIPYAKWMLKSHSVAYSTSKIIDKNNYDGGFARTTILGETNNNI